MKKNEEESELRKKINQDQLDFYLDKGEEEYQKGDVMGWIATVILSHLKKTTLPRWAVDVLCQRLTENPKEAIKGLFPSSKKGRHAYFATEENDKLHNRRLLAAVEICIENGLKGDSKFEKANEILEFFGSGVEIDSIKSLYTRHKKIEAPSKIDKEHAQLIFALLSKKEQNPPN